MATSLENVSAMDILLIHGKEKIPLHMDISDSDIEGDSLTVHHLAKEVEKATMIEPDSQRLIYRGKTLFKTFDPKSPSLKKTLSSLSISNGARVMVLGKPGRKRQSSPEENKGRKRQSSPEENKIAAESRPEEKSIADLMRVLDEHQAKINEICSVCTDAVERMKKEPGNIGDWKKQQKFFLAQSEYSMKELTLLDATPGGISDEYRAKRRALVNQLLSNVSLCDQQIENLKQSINSWEEQNGR